MGDSSQSVSIPSLLQNSTGRGEKRGKGRRIPSMAKSPVLSSPHQGAAICFCALDLAAAEASTQTPPGRSIWEQHKHLDLGSFQPPEAGIGIIPVSRSRNWDNSASRGRNWDNPALTVRNWDNSVFSGRNWDNPALTVRNWDNSSLQRQELG